MNDPIKHFLCFYDNYATREDMEREIANGNIEEDHPYFKDLEAFEFVKNLIEKTNDSIQLPIKDARIIRDMFSELISFDECEGHEEPPEYVYRLETQLSILMGDTTNAHMCWEEST